MCQASSLPHCWGIMLNFFSHSMAAHLIMLGTRPGFHPPLIYLASRGMVDLASRWLVNMVSRLGGWGQVSGVMEDLPPKALAL